MMLKRELEARLAEVARALETSLTRERRFVVWMEGRDAQVRTLFQQLDSIQRQYWNDPAMAELQDAQVGRWRAASEMGARPIWPVTDAASARGKGKRPVPARASGGHARAVSLTKAERSASAKRAAEARWAKARKGDRR